MKILMAIDDERSAKQLQHAVIEQFQPAKWEVKVLHVLQPAHSGPVPQMSPNWAPELEEERREAQALVHFIAQHLKDAGFVVETEVEIGDVRECILDVAEAWHADILVLGSHGRNPVRRFLMGSVATSVAMHASCTVELVRGPAPA